MKYENIYKVLTSISELDENKWSDFEPLLQETQYTKSDILVKPGEKADKIHFVLEGIARNFFTSKEGREYTKMFRGPGGMIGPYMEVLADIPVRYSIQAVTKLKTVSCSLIKVREMMDADPQWQRIGRVLGESNFIEKERREFMLMHMNIEEKYQAFSEQFSEIKDSIPQYQIASYLSVTPEALNRFLKRA